MVANNSKTAPKISRRKKITTKTITGGKVFKHTTVFFAYIDFLLLLFFSLSLYFIYFMCVLTSVDCNDVFIIEKQENRQTQWNEP